MKFKTFPNCEFSSQKKLQNKQKHKHEKQKITTPFKKNTETIAKNSTKDCPGNTIVKTVTKTNINLRMMDKTTNTTIE